ncbi:MAG: LamG-like jellyroll fold domain-containing protein, partial [Verrucomicrobiota bacterium]
DNSLQSEGGELETNDAEGAMRPWLKIEEPAEPVASRPSNLIPFPRFAQMAAAAAIAFLVGSAVMYLGVRNGEEQGGDLVQPNTEEPSARGFAVLGQLYDVEWIGGATSREKGDILGAETVRLASGMAEIQFFSGANMVVEGPAEISLKSAWEASCHEGSVRMQVPPAARGFKLHAPQTEIIDLGTEFGLEVRGGESHVEVFDGEIAVRHQGGDEQLITEGGALGLPADQPAQPADSGKTQFPDVRQFGPQAVAQRAADFARWEMHRDQLAADKRLIAYYTFDGKETSGLVPNLAIPRESFFDGSVILAEPVSGRWPTLKSALEFRRPGSRVRVNIPGEFPAFTFMSWVRIDSLDRWYNALFMGDGYETGEPHWQIRNDGKLMLSVMVDDTRPNPKSPNDAGFHRVYFSPPMWDLSMSGEWLHLTSVFDPGERVVSHYVNGERISEQFIEDEYQISTVRIGNGEIGNWGLPFREDPTFAIRNLNGRMDELAIFRAALKPGEIARLYHQSRAKSR